MSESFEDLLEQCRKNCLKIRAIYRLMTFDVAKKAHERFRDTFTNCLKENNLEGLKYLLDTLEKSDLHLMSIRDLRLEARRLHVVNFSTMTREMLIKRILERRDAISRINEKRNFRSGSETDEI